MSSTGKLRFGICGLGFMGRTYFNHLRAHPRATIAAVCDRNPELRAGRWSQTTGNIAPRAVAPPPSAVSAQPGAAGPLVDLAGIAAYADVADLLRDPNVDVVAITLPTPLHAGITEQALSAGKAVICEKPMARDLAECDRMLAAARRSGRPLIIAQCIRFWPQYEIAKELVNAGRLGPIRFVKLTRIGSPPLYSDQNWLMQGAQSGGALLDLHVHDVDFAQHLLGVPATVYARGSRGPSGEIDHVVATYTYADGRYALLEGGWSYHAPRPFEMALTVCGETATLEWNSRAGPDVLWYAGANEPQRIACADRTGWERTLDYFADCLADELLPTRCLPESSRTSVALALLEKQSIRDGAALPVPDRADY